MLFSVMIYGQAHVDLKNVQEELLKSNGILETDEFYKQEIWLIQNNVIVGLGIGSLFAG